MKKLLRVPLLGGALTLLVLASGVSVAHATHAWGTYHWASKTHPFTLQIGNNLTGTWSPILQKDADGSGVIPDWNAMVGKTKLDASGQPVAEWTKQEIILSKIPGTAGSRCKAVEGTTQVCNNKYGNNGWLGLATIWLSGNHITKGTAKMNDSYFNWATYNNPNEKKHVMCQEVAHTFGLGHQSEDGTSLNTCMDYFSNTGGNAENSQSTVPNYHDYEQLSKIYNSDPLTGGHLDTSTTLAAAASALATQADATDSGDDNQRQWGRLLSQSKNGRSSVYEQTLENGIQIVRHVFWTEETAAKCQACDHRFHDKD